MAAYRKLVLLPAQQQPTRDCPSRPRLVYLTPKQLDELADAYRHGATVYDLAERFQVNRRTVSKRLKQQGVELCCGRLYEPDISRARELSTQGLTAAEISVVLGKSELLVWRVLRQQACRG